MKAHLFLYGLAVAFGSYTLYMMLSGRNTWPTDRVAVSNWFWPWGTK
jgi:hypothetical protein